MNAILLNDTDLGEHVGCELVVRNTRRMCEKYGITLTHTFKTREARDNAPAIVKQFANNQLLLLNGEGTMHDDKSRALALLKLASQAKKEGLKTVLYNSLWENNPKGENYLRDFDLIFCRDSFSAAEIEKAHPSLKATVVPDIVFATVVSGDLKVV